MVDSRAAPAQAPRLTAKPMQSERHRTDRIGWLRAGVLGANDGIVSTSSLIIGVLAGGVGLEKVLLTGLAGLVAGAMSMAAGEYVSVQAQADTESADLATERKELTRDPAAEQRELAAIYVTRGVDAKLALEIAGQLMAQDALGAHARDELGISEHSRPRPIQAALVSAASFALGAALPLGALALAPTVSGTVWVVIVSLACLMLTGATAALIGGSSVTVSVLRVTIGGALAMGITAGTGALFGAAP